jgi:hypothetical protein
LTNGTGTSVGYTVSKTGESHGLNYNWSSGAWALDAGTTPVTYQFGSSATFGANLILNSVSPILDFNPPSGTTSGTINFDVNASRSWQVQGTTSSFVVARYVGGAFQDSPIIVSNSTGNVTFADAIVPNSTKGIVGTATNDNANAGSVGEYQTSTGSAIGLTSGNYVDLATLPLTAGDWDIQGFVNFNGSSLAATTWVVGINTVANTQPSNPNLQFQTFSSGILTGGSLISPTVRQSLASTTTIRCGGRMDFASGSVTATGTIRARRIR